MTRSVYTHFEVGQPITECTSLALVVQGEMVFIIPRQLVLSATI